MFYKCTWSKHGCDVMLTRATIQSNGVRALTVANNFTFPTFPELVTVHLTSSY